MELDPIMINEDDFPEGNETFFLSLMKGEKTETLNIFPSTSPATVVIQDNDGIATNNVTVSLHVLITWGGGIFAQLFVE